MKKDIAIFAANAAAVFLCVCLAVHLSPAGGSFVSSAQRGLLAAAAPYTSLQNDAQNIFSAFFDKEEKAADNNNTTQEDSRGVMRITGQGDGPAGEELTATPDDIAQLMKAEEEAIAGQQKKGATSEESYTGGGTIVAFGNVQIQDKIPKDFYYPDIEELLEEKAALSIDDPSQPTVLVYHSHTTESYNLLDVGYYTESSGSKTKDIARNMVRVGDDLCRVLEANGIGVVHDREIHDSSYNAAYDSSRKSVAQYLEKYPTIEITIDVHRDSITYKNGTKVKPTAIVMGKKAAKMMLISGCEYGSVNNFPSWEKNLRFSCAVAQKIGSMYEGLMRPILFSERKYNMDLTPNSFLLEIGTDANTLDEACYSARLFATALSQLILNEYTAS